MFNVVFKITSFLCERIFLHTESWKYTDMASNALTLFILFDSRYQLDTLQAFSHSPLPPSGGEENHKVKVNLVGWEKNILITGKEMQQ